MRLLALATVLSFAALVPTARAQTSVFATITETDYGFYPANSNVFYTKGDGAGFTGGVSYNFHKDSRLILGMDGRASYSPGTQGGTYEAIAFRIGLVPDRNILRPYFQDGLGVISSTTNWRTANGSPGSADYFAPGRYTNFAEEVEFGLDIKLTNSFDLRALELGGVLGISNGPSVTTGTISTGLVYHLHPLGRTHKP